MLQRLPYIRPVDSASGKRVDNATFSWQFRSPKTGEVVPPSLLFDRVTSEGSQVTLNGLRKDVNLEAMTGSDKLHGECVAEIPCTPDKKDTRNYPSDPHMLIEAGPGGEPRIGVVEEEKSKQYIHL